LIDREWSHPVVLPADPGDRREQQDGHEFCRELLLCPRGHTVKRENTTYSVFCFADPAHADLFRENFAGERFDPRDRGRGSEWFRWRQS
jgi:hypothetical protein